MATSYALGTPATVELTAGTVAYRTLGEGPPVVFIHGLLVNADLWRNVVPTVAAAGYRCIAPDWPLGAHEHPLAPGSAFDLPALADLVAEFLDALDLQDVTVVANDTGGALTQVLLTRHPGRVARAVLSSCDAYDRFLPPPVNLLPPLAALPGQVWLLLQVTRPRWVQRLPIAFGWLTKRPIPKEMVASYLGPARRSRAIRRDVKAVLRAVDKRYTLAAAEDFAKVDIPVLLAWAQDDRLFPVKMARRLEDELPQARLVEIPDSYTFTPEDNPAALAEAIVEFLR